MATPITPSVRPARPRPRPRRATKTRQTAFLDGLRETGTLSGAARQSHVSRSTHYRWLARDPDYESAFAAATDEATDRLEEEARRRALDGVDEPIFYRGERIGVTRRYSDALLILLLRAKRPEQFRDTVDLTTRTDDTGTVLDPAIIKTLTDEEIQLARRLGRKLAGLDQATKEPS